MKRTTLALPGGSYPILDSHDAVAVRYYSGSGRSCGCGRRASRAGGFHDHMQENSLERPWRITIEGTSE